LIYKNMKISKIREAASSLVFLAVSFVLIACFSAPRLKKENVSGLPPEHSAENSQEQELAGKPFDLWQNNPEDFYAIITDKPGAGDPVSLIFFQAADADSSLYTALKVSCINKNGKRISGASFFDWQPDGSEHQVKAAVFTIPSTYDDEDILVKIENGADISHEFRLTLEKRLFVSEEIALNPSNTALRTEPDPKKTEQAQKLGAIISRHGPAVYTEGPFSAPVAADTRRTSFFGDRRVYRYSNGKTDTAIHAGIDYGVPTGTPVHACAAGKVALSAERIVTGNSVIVEHLPGVYSIYYHLDKLNVAEGATVQKGDIIGFSGATGLATGPHLHWEVRVATENTDPDTLCRAPLLDGEAALRIITERGEALNAQFSR
jgi:murein DD-endopeptidase MepM/ murein hydrolase activator NlpD